MQSSQVDLEHPGELRDFLREDGEYGKPSPLQFFEIASVDLPPEIVHEKLCDENQESNVRLENTCYEGPQRKNLQ